MTTVQAKTKDTILRTAERLFAEQGFETTLRDITTEAKVNIALVNYHFGSKAKLLRTVLQDIIVPVKKCQMERLVVLESGTSAPTLEQLLDAFLVPIMDLLQYPNERGVIVAHLFARAMVDSTKEVQEMIIGWVESTEKRYIEAFKRALPLLSEDEIWWRFTSMFGAFIVQQSGLLITIRTRGGCVLDKETEYQRMKVFLLAGFQAPATTDC
ncbi:TetR/AcrR family transcriptional regulator [Tengunoibacter tsumagoiensis]|nr:TetR/AcrR family transcriptional regulator [Tengunoibacter tsumagoiensis]